MCQPILHSLPELAQFAKMENQHYLLPFWQSTLLSFLDLDQVVYMESQWWLLLLVKITIKNIILEMGTVTEILHVLVKTAQIFDKVSFL